MVVSNNPFYITSKRVGHQPELEDGRLYVVFTTKGPARRFVLIGLYDPQQNFLQIFDENRSHLSGAKAAIERDYGETPDIEIT